MDYHSSSTAPTAPPQEATVFEYPVTATAIVPNDNNNNNHNVQLTSNTISTSNSPGTINVRAHSPIPWSTGLCGCFQDIHTCCLTCWCPCITFGRIAELVDRGSTSCGVSGALYMLIMCVTGCSCLYSCFYRSKLRGQYFLEETPCTDCCIHCCCEECALCQEYRELKNQGFDMSIGWHGNVQRQNRLTAPTMQPGMNSSS